MKLNYFNECIQGRTEKISGEGQASVKNYSENDLAQAPPDLKLPVDFPGSNSLPDTGEIYLDDLLESQVSKFSKFKQSKNTSLFIIFYSAFSSWLSRICKQEKFLIGVSLMSTWRENEVEQTVLEKLGNWVVCHVNLVGNPAFSDVLLRVTRGLEEVEHYQDDPFREVAKYLQKQQETDQSQPVQVAFSWEIGSGGERLGGENNSLVEPYPLEEQGNGAFDFHLTVKQKEEKLQLRWQYNADLFQQETIVRLAQGFKTMLMSAIAQPEQPIAELPLMAETECYQHGSGMERLDPCIHHLFEAQVQRLPQKTAVIDHEQHFTYEQLNQAANQVAHYLQSLGVGSETLVGIFMPRCFNLMVGVLGILKAGAAYIPLDPAYPSERIAYMIDDSQISVLLVQDHTHQPPQTQVKLIDLYWDWELIADYPTDNPTSNTTPQNLAYLIYTSGSTGKPKGVMIEHRSLVTFAQKAAQEYEITETDRILQFASFSFDAAVEEIYTCLSVGATLVLRPETMLDSMPTFLRLCQDYRLTVLDLPTAYWHLLVEVLVKQPELTFPPDIRCVIIGGERANPYYVEQWQNCVSGSPVLINTYGPTEATVVATTYRLPTEVSTDPELPIGKPLPHVEVYILDEEQQPVSGGEAGELYLGGIGVARGYLNRPEVTEKSFIPNHFHHQPDARLYKTGDLVRYRPDGNLEFLGRIDQQVKIRGYRVDVGEIQATLTSYPGIHQVFITTQPDRLGHQQIIAYLVSDFIPDRIPYEVECFLESGGALFHLRTVDISPVGVGLQDAPPGLQQRDAVRLRFPLPNQEEEHWFQGKVVWQQGSRLGVELNPLPVEQTLLQQSAEYLLEAQGLLKSLQRTVTGILRTYLQRKLPNYMIPANFILMNALPLTPNGKVDQKQLPSLDRESTQLTVSEAVVTQNETEQQLAAIWSRLLSVSEVGLEDDFFELGGNSLLAIECIHRVSAQLQIEIAVSVLVQHPTLASFAKAITSDSNPSAIAASQGVDLQTEAKLDQTIQYRTPANFTKAQSPSSVFLTGATGFVGPYLLSQLLEQTKADVYCLVRYRPGESARERIEKQLKSYALWHPSYRQRIVPVIGDLSKPALGLTSEQFEDLANSIDVIYHSGAWVNFVYPYSALRDTNVQGTQEILRLASCRQTRPVHFVSTLSVFPETYADQGLVLETDLPLDEEELQTGYGQSKWVAEQLVREAQDRGLPATIHRFGTLVGDSRTGMTHKPNDFFFSLIKGCLQLGKAPHLSGKINLTPINYATQAMVYLTQQSTNWGQTFHVINPSSISWETLLRDMQANGYCLETQPFSFWLSELREQVQAGYRNELATFLSILNEEEDLPLDNIEFDTTLSQAVLSKSSLICPPVNAHLMLT